MQEFARNSALFRARKYAGKRAKILQLCDKYSMIKNRHLRPGPTQRVRNRADAEERRPEAWRSSDAHTAYGGEERESAAAENTRAHARNIGNILAGRYQIGKALSHNGEGITYLAYDNQENTRVEIREYFPGNLCARPAGEYGSHH